jgi:hypothetical protein
VVVVVDVVVVVVVVGFSLSHFKYKVAENPEPTLSIVFM